MRVEFINPFIESVCDLFSTMLTCEAKRGVVNVSKSGPFGGEIAAIIGLSGPARGTVALSFPKRTALLMVNRLLGTTTTELDESVMDAVAEFVNIVAGGAKAKLNGDTGTPPITLSLPTVIRGKEYSVEAPSWSVWLDVPFTSDLGPFNLRVSFESDSNKKGK